MGGRIKVKQIDSGSSSKGETIISDGNGNFTVGFSKLQSGDTFPPIVTSGDTYYRTDLHEIFYYDLGRSKWLSINKMSLSCGRSIAENSTASYMYIGSAVQSSTSGFRMPYNGTILSASIQNTTVATASRTLDIRINNSTVNRAQLVVNTGNTGVSSKNLNVDFTEDDLIQCVLLIGDDTYNDVIVLLEVARRV